MGKAKKYTLQELKDKELYALRIYKKETWNIHFAWTAIDGDIEPRSEYLKSLIKRKDEHIKIREEYSQKAQKIREKINTMEQRSPNR
ncbi:hypothetical protein AALA44_01205 [Enterococcus ratti]|uniref:hypothetical protein n=1 Tax=Enterococcus ratti TaxID=150033 RepID=UPI0035189A98